MTTDMERRMLRETIATAAADIEHYYDRFGSIDMPEPYREIVGENRRLIRDCERKLEQLKRRTTHAMPRTE